MANKSVIKAGDWVKQIKYNDEGVNPVAQVVEILGNACTHRHVGSLVVNGCSLYENYSDLEDCNFELLADEDAKDMWKLAYQNK